MQLSEAKDWQKDPMRLKTSKVQYWSASGVMITAMMSLADARESVESGKAFVITSQAIGQYDNESAQ